MPLGCTGAPQLSATAVDVTFTRVTTIVPTGVALAVRALTNALVAQSAAVQNSAANEYTVNGSRRPIAIE